MLLMWFVLAVVVLGILLIGVIKFLAGVLLYMCYALLIAEVNERGDERIANPVTRFAFDMLCYGLAIVPIIWWLWRFSSWLGIFLIGVYLLYLLVAICYFVYRLAHGLET